MNILPLFCLVGALSGQLPAPELPPSPPAAASRPAEDDDFVLTSKTQRHMATDFTIQVRHLKRQQPDAAIEEAFARIAALDRMMTDYDPDSELSRLSAASPHERPVSVSFELWDILQQGARISELTEGAFDTTVGPVTRLWRQARRQKRIPEADKLEAALAGVGWRNVKLSQRDDAHYVQLTRPAMRLDLGGIAQGYGVDAAFAILAKHGYHHTLINASGDIRVGRAPPGTEGWKIGLASLDPQSPPSEFIYLAETALSTSGDAFQFVEFDGRRYSHIVDPRTGIGVTTPMSVTVLAKTCTEADALASALCVLGPKSAESLRLSGETKVAALFLMKTDDGVQRIATSGWKERHRD